MIKPLFMRREKNPKPSRPASDEKENLRLPADYWSRIADDAAHGYGADSNRGRKTHTRLNEDQQPGDNERG
jgi:hypothetical protein